MNPAEVWQALFAPAFTLWGSPVTWAELLACVLSVWMVFCNMRVDALGWPLAIASSLIYALLFAQYQLYGEAGLQLLFIAFAAWGWFQWLLGRGDDGDALRVRRLERRRGWVAVAVGMAAWPLLGLLLDHWTDSTVPYFDALPTVASIVGTVLLARKFIENWPVWIAVNVVSVGLFVYKSLWLTALVYIVFAVLAFNGWRAWTRIEGQVRAHAG